MNIGCGGEDSVMQQHNHQWLQWLWRVGQRSWLSHLFKAVHRLRETVLPDAGSPNPKFNPTLLELGALVEVMEHALSGIAKLDADGRYLYINKSYAEMVGLQPEAMIGMNWKQTVHPDHLEQLKSAYQQMLQDGKVELEARGIRTDGSSFYKQLVMISSYDQQQRFTGHYCFAKDISDRKQNEIALQNSQARFAGILEIASDAIISVNTAHQITLFPQSIC
jgi:two-component system, sensor histidine kinase and response regulator